MLKRRLPQLSIAISALILAAAIVIMSILGQRPSAATTALFPEGPTAQEVSAALRRVNLDPRSLAAAGVSSNAVGTVVSNVKTYLTDNPGTLAAADGSYAQYRAQVESLENRIRAGIASVEELQSVSTARTNLAAAQTTRQTRLDAIFTAGVTSLSNTQKTVLASIRANAPWELATEYLTVDRSETQWVQLRDALVNERQAATYGEQADAAAQTLLTETEANNTVAAAISNLSNNISAVTAAWNQAVNQ